MNETKELREGIEALVKKYQQIAGKGKSALKEVNEADVRADFIDPFFELLGWDVKNPEVYNRERYVRGTGFVDIVILDNGKPVMFIEAKRFGEVHSNASISPQRRAPALTQRSNAQKIPCL